MHKLVLFIIFVIAFAGGYWYLKNNTTSLTDKVQHTVQQIEENSNIPLNNNQNENSQNQKDAIKIIAENLDTPWAVAIMPSGQMLVTERVGRVRLVDTNGLQNNPVATINSVKEVGEGGLLGVTLHPEFSSNGFVYLYYTYGSSGNNTQNRVARMTFKDGKLSDEKTIVDAIPGASNHDGGRIKFGPDKMLYIGTGDAQEPSRAQDTNNLAGKILRVTENGDPAPGNPFNNHVYSYGHRNVQGIAWDADGQIWATEHGRSGALSGLDELNKIESGKNYGWPEIQGNETRDGMIAPAKNSGNTTWAPSGVAFLNGSLFFSGLRGESLYQATVSGSSVTDFKEHMKGQYGRTRDVIAGPDNMLYITTSNKDGRGTPNEGDDKVIQIDTSKL
jgi:glucose/arabinose dehydrogenase